YRENYATTPGTHASTLKIDYSNLLARANLCDDHNNSVRDDNNNDDARIAYFFFTTHALLKKTILIPNMEIFIMGLHDES
ncbi:MAG: hypothetical protein ACXACA_08850, partial [Candidatus Ranarchaeia archaeon]